MIDLFGPCLFFQKNSSEFLSGFIINTHILIKFSKNYAVPTHLYEYSTLIFILNLLHVADCTCSRFGDLEHYCGRVPYLRTCKENQQVVAIYIYIYIYIYI